MHVAGYRIGLSSLPGQLSPGLIRHCTISVLPFDVIVSYKCSKDAYQGHKLATDRSQRIYHWIYRLTLPRYIETRDTSTIWYRNHCHETLYPKTWRLRQHHSLDSGRRTRFETTQQNDRHHSFLGTRRLQRCASGRYTERPGNPGRCSGSDPRSG